MRAAVLLALLLVTVGCDADYDPPKPYAIGAYYSGTGRSFGSTLGGVQFIVEDVVVPDAGGGSDDVGGSDIAADIAMDLSEDYFTCIDDYSEEDFPGYCLCMEGVNAGSQEDTLCKCEFLVCVENYDQATLSQFYAQCNALFDGGLCEGPQ